MLSESRATRTGWLSLVEIAVQGLSRPRGIRRVRAARRRVTLSGAEDVRDGELDAVKRLEREMVPSLELADGVVALGPRPLMEEDALVLEHDQPGSPDPRLRIERQRL